ncbi:hypothetical protein ACJMK2_000530 [Sinanodonta woodiana]|uniref:Thiaminase-2/PQQC domain-containing protein n=1 Tax=Sinanodonta woodiana TaxID=1069815 RepID=A0ABD3XRA7_SINWO
MSSEMSARISPKHAGLLAHLLAESELFRDLAERASQLRLNAEDEPLSEFLWRSTQSQQDDALQSKFIQGLRCGNLDPTYFGGFMVQDSIYCYNSKGSIDKAAGKTTCPIFKAFLEKKSDSYKKYYEELFNLWHIRDPNGIELSKACEEYAALERNVAELMGPLYLVVALIPCYKLWPWLGKQLLDSPHNFGVYESWVKANLDPTYDGYKKLEQLIDDAFLVGAIDKEQALSVYQGCMTGEAQFFSYV